MFLNILMLLTSIYENVELDLFKWLTLVSIVDAMIFIIVMMMSRFKVDFLRNCFIRFAESKALLISLTNFQGYKGPGVDFVYFLWKFSKKKNLFEFRNSPNVSLNWI